MIQNHLIFKGPSLKRDFKNITDILETLSFLRNRRERSQTIFLITIYSSTRFSGHRQFFFQSRKWRKRKVNKKQRKRPHNLSFAQKTSLILRTSTHSTLKKTSTHNTAKNPSHFLNFPASNQLASEKTFALDHFQTPKNCILKAL